jgi:type II secretory pathway predicted ATPase ExeA
MIETKVGLEMWNDLPLARATDPETSHRAARDAAGRAGAQRRQVLQVLTLAPRTNDEIDVYMGWRVGTAGRRTGELVKLGLIERTATTRQTRTGSAAFVFTITPR